jgi:hypothetical protein
MGKEVMMEVELLSDRVEMITRAARVKEYIGTTY